MVHRNALNIETQKLWQRLGVDVVQGYATSECSPVVACGLPRRTPPGSVGPALKNVEVRLSSDAELQVRGPNVMRGYWRAQRTAQVLSRDGWYATGDLADIDAHGDIWRRPSEERGWAPAMRFRTGVVHIAEALDAPVVPFGLAGTEEAMPPFLDDFHGPVIGGVRVGLRRTVVAIASEADKARARL